MVSPSGTWGTGSTNVQADRGLRARARRTWLGEQVEPEDERLAIEQKIFCPLGRGVVDWAGLAAALRETGYDGAATVEQDIDPAISLNPADDARAGLAYLRSVGF